MADLFSSFRSIDDKAVSLDLARGIFRHERIRHPMSVTGFVGPANPQELEAAFTAKYPDHEIPLNLAHEDPEYLSDKRFMEVSATMHALADALSWSVSSDDDDDYDNDEC